MNRNKATQLILNKIKTQLNQTDTVLSPDVLIGIAKNLEIGIFNYSVSNSDSKTFNKIYSRRFINISWNITNNPFFLEKILTKKWSFYFISTLKSDDLFIEEKNKILEQMKKKKLEGEEAQKAMKQKGAFKCGRCKTNETEYKEVFSRSADEPPIVRVKCLNCGNAFRFN